MKHLVYALFVLCLYLVIQAIPLDRLFEESNLTPFVVEQREEIIRNVLVTVCSIPFLQMPGKMASTSKISVEAGLILLIPTYLICIGLLILKDMPLSEIPTSQAVLLFLSTLSIGFSEEFIFRGLIQMLLLKALLEIHNEKALLISVVASSMVFGFLHLLDFRMEHVVGEMTQFIYATFIGIGFGAIFLKTNKLWVLAIIHGLIDFVFSLDELPVFMSNTTNSSSIVSSVMTVLVALPMLVVGLRVIGKLDSALIRTNQDH